MQSHEHAMSDAVRSHETTLELLFDATSGLKHSDLLVVCRHCDQPIHVDGYGTWTHDETDDEMCTFEIPENYPVRLVASTSAGAATCGACGLSWNDEISTDLTPTPAGRCAFESLHESAAPTDEMVSMLESAGVDVDDVEESATEAIDAYVLDVDTKTVLTVTLGVGGPTVYMSADIWRNSYGSWERNSRVTFVDSWAVPSETGLSDDSYLVTLFDRYVESYQPADD